MKENNIKNFIKTKIRNAYGFNEIYELLRNIETYILYKSEKGTDISEQATLVELQGTQYSRYLMPLDYMPSRDLHPRWGYTKPCIPEIESLLAHYDASYIETLEYMKTLDVGHIAMDYDPGAPFSAAWRGGALNVFDELALYALVTRYEPQNYFEIGSGMSTCFAKQAVIDASLSTRIISIDPEPRAKIDHICDEVYRCSLETIDINYFDQLQRGDILFIDGSHRIFMNSDVTVFFIDILPRIKPGVVIHLHDIVLPYDYPEFFTKWYWSEQYILAVYLMSARERVMPILPTCYICRNKKFESWFQHPFIDIGFNAEDWRGGGSFWFTKIE